MPEFADDPLEREQPFAELQRKHYRGKLIRLDLAVAAQILFAKRLGVIVIPTVLNIAIAKGIKDAKGASWFLSFLLRSFGPLVRATLLAWHYSYDVRKMNEAVDLLFKETRLMAEACYHRRLFGAGKKRDNRRTRRRVWSRNG